MNKQIEAMKLALEALKTCDVVDYQQDFDYEKVAKAVTALREALAEQPAQQEHVGYLNTAYKLTQNELKRLSEENFGRMPCDEWADSVLDLRDHLETRQTEYKK